MEEAWFLIGAYLPLIAKKHGLSPETAWIQPGYSLEKHGKIPEKHGCNMEKQGQSRENHGEEIQLQGFKKV